MNRLFLLFLIFLTAVNTRPAPCEEPLKIVTTLSSYADIAKIVGGDRVTAAFIAQPRFNPHFIEPRPSDVLKVKRCDLFVHSGLDLEAWRDPLLNAAGRSDLRQGGERQLDLSIGIPLLEVPVVSISRAAGDIHIYGNPHYWLDPQNGLRISKSIADKLSALDPAGSEVYGRNQKALSDKLKDHIKRWSELALPFKGAELIAYHNEWIYLTDFLGLKVNQFLEPKPGIPPTPQHMENLAMYAKEKKIRAIIQASFYPLDSSQYVAKKCGAKSVLLAHNVSELPEASDYVSMLDFNIKSILEALGQ